MTQLVFYSRSEDMPSAGGRDPIRVLLYGSQPALPDTASLGHQVRKACASLPCTVLTNAFDFLTIALAVTAADTFVSRLQAPDRWTRSLDLNVPLVDPAPWCPLVEDLQHSLRFLTGDDWTIRFRAGGAPPPTRGTRNRQYFPIDLQDVDCASLFSGGLDSALGAVGLHDEGRWPLLVSHAYTKDREYQKRLSRMITARSGRQPPMFLANANPTWIGRNDESMRSRSFNFLAYGAVAATSVATFHNLRKATLFVPENGTIAVNAPLTLRRIGSHSTRTTHPHFLASLQAIFDRVEIPVSINNQFRHQTKGEMMAPYVDDADLRAMARATVSCGKWKRLNVQCGRCLPCLIRRAAFHEAGIADGTTYKHQDLEAVLRNGNGRDDLVSVLSAIERPRARFETWVAQSGPLPDDLAERAGFVDVFRRGLNELREFLVHSGVG